MIRTIASQSRTSCSSSMNEYVHEIKINTLFFVFGQGRQNLWFSRKIKVQRTSLCGSTQRKESIWLHEISIDQTNQWSECNHSLFELKKFAHWIDYFLRSFFKQITILFFRISKTSRFNRPLETTRLKSVFFCLSSGKQKILHLTLINVKHLLLLPIKWFHIFPLIFELTWLDFLFSFISNFHH